MNRLNDRLQAIADDYVSRDLFDRILQSEEDKANKITIPEIIFDETETIEPEKPESEDKEENGIGQTLVDTQAKQQLTSFHVIVPSSFL